MIVSNKYQCPSLTLQLPHLFSYLSLPLSSFNASLAICSLVILFSATKLQLPTCDKALLWLRVVDLAAPLTMAAEAEFVKVEGLDFPKVVKPTDGSKPLKLLGHGITDMEIHFLQVKFTAIGIYLDDESVSSHLQKWHGKTADEIIRDESFFKALIHAPVEKFIRIVIIKEIKGAQYGLQLENATRERLAAIDKYEEEEESALEKLVEFFRAKYLKSNTIITFHIPADSSKGVQVGVLAEGKEENRTSVDNQNLGEMIAEWYLGGSSALSPSTISSLAQGVAALL